ncbi:MAG: GMC family oxidoreductase [Hahellaceae bacterium]|nr:GMC family oxidoreductase [Hahellaceae bacterium]
MIGPSFQHSPDAVWQVYRSELERAENVHVYLWANAVGFDTDPQGVRVTGIPVKTLNGLTFTVKARYYVLSAGSIENARLLLLSNQSVRAGLGNQHDVVGRYFNDHPMARIGKIVFADVGEALEGPPKSKGIRGVLTLSTAGMREKKVARVMGMVSPVSKMTTRQALSYFWKTSKRIWNNEEDLTEKIASVTSAMGRLQNDLGAIHGWSDTQAAYLDVVIEQLPCRDSRVTLSDEVDALGLPKVVLDWRFVPEQEELTQRAFQLMAEQIGASGLGRMQITESLSFANPSAFLFRSSFHHMGTTRMGTDPSISVVDPNSRVHTVDNLYIAGSSVFPTTGVSNPTLTIVAMTLRLAEHLKAKLV